MVELEYQQGDEIVEKSSGRRAVILEIREIANVLGYWISDDQGAKWFLQPNWSKNWTTPKEYEKLEKKRNRKKRR